MQYWNPGQSSGNHGKGECHELFSGDHGRARGQPRLLQLLDCESVRSCSLCKAQDRPIILEDMCNCKGGDDLAGHATACRAIQHFVTRDIQTYTGKEKPLTLDQKRKGWKATGVFQGKQANERLICRDCIRRQEDVSELAAFYKKCGEEAQSDREMNFYEILCN